MTATNTLSKCRVCFCHLGEDDASYDMEKLPELAQKFVICTDLIVIEEEAEGQQQLPTELCEECRDLLEQSFAFRAKCIAADLQWRLELTEASEANCRKEGMELQLANEETEIEIGVPELEAEEEEHANAQEQPFAAHTCSSCGIRYPTAHQCQQKETMSYNSEEDSSYRCHLEGCQKVYRHKPTLTMHQRRCHRLGPELKSHVCEFCGKVFNSTSVLNDHRYTHKDQSELPHACPEAECARRFASKEKLKVHLMRHAGIKNFSCSYCGMRKTTRNELKIHMNYHTLERTWPCRFCSKVCHSSGNLKMHVRAVHERAKDYACSYCERSFAKADTRKYHEMTHTGEKPHRCEECGKHFTQPAALRTHRKIHERQRNESHATVYTLSLGEADEASLAPAADNQ